MTHEEARKIYEIPGETRRALSRDYLALLHTLAASALRRAYDCPDGATWQNIKRSCDRTAIAYFRHSHESHDLLGWYVERQVECEGRLALELWDMCNERDCVADTRLCHRSYQIGE